MTNIEMAIAILAKHREARMWADDVVAADMLAQLGVDPAGIVQMTEAEPEGMGVEPQHTPFPEAERPEAAQDAPHE